MLPDFVIVGAARSGTTSLYRYCAEHPEIFMSGVKETNFFSSNPFEFTRATYERLFETANGACAVGEASPSYLYDAVAPAAIKQAIPECRIVIILRDPGERLISDFYYSQGWGSNLDVDFTTFLTACIEREGAGRQGFVPALMAEKGMYAEQVQRYLDVFSERRMFIRLFDDLQENPRKVVAELYEFLGVDSSFEPELEQVHNANSEPVFPLLSRLIKRAGRLETLLVDPLVPSTMKGRVTNLMLDLNRRRRGKESVRRSITPEDRARLAQLYHVQTHALERLIDRDLSHWLRC
ncbi:MAG: sulfotransferase domain-containing protein [Rhodothermales bacterium]